MIRALINQFHGFKDSYDDMDFTASQFAPTSAKPCILESISVETAGKHDYDANVSSIAIRSCAVKRKSPLTSAVRGHCLVERKRFELSTSALRTQRSPS